mmetsp:Transcript_34011/g.59278  ORF Transcript_34011/g.59278 Transcript_34011/m.59278 type:complete len:409 (+) Transcript_34011:1995-3221(+)
MSLDRLREILEDVKENVLSKTKDQTSPSSIDESDLCIRMESFAKSLYPKEFLSRSKRFEASVLTHLSNEYKKPLLITDIGFYELVIEALKEPAVAPESLYPEVKYEGGFEELIEKLVLLNFLDSPDFWSFILQGQNVLNLMFGGQFKVPLSTIKEAFMKARAKYTPGLRKLLSDELNFIKELPGIGRTTVSLQTHTQDILGRDSGFTIELFQSSEYDERILSLLSKQIEANIRKKIEVGISQTRELKALKMLEGGETNTYNEEVVNRLVVEANAELKLIRLPENLKKYERMIVSNIKASQLAKADFTPSKGTTGKFLHDESLPVKMEIGSESRKLLKKLGYSEKAIDKIQPEVQMGGEVDLSEVYKEGSDYQRLTPYGLRGEYFRKGDAELFQELEQKLKEAEESNEA